MINPFVQSHTRECLFIDGYSITGKLIFTMAEYNGNKLVSVVTYNISGIFHNIGG